MSEVNSALATLVENLGSVPTRQLTIICDYSSGGGGSLTPSCRHMCRQNSKSHKIEVKIKKEVGSYKKVI